MSEVQSTTVAFDKPLNKTILNNGVEYKLKINPNPEKKEEDDENNTPINFLPILYDTIEPLEYFIEISNVVYGTLYPGCQPNSSYNVGLVKKMKKATLEIKSFDGVAYTTNDESKEKFKICLSTNYLYRYYHDRLNEINQKTKFDETKPSKVSEGSTASFTKTVLINDKAKTTTTVTTTTIITTVVEDYSAKGQLDKNKQEALQILRHEISGVICHELVHGWQMSCDGTPSNLIEGIADGIRTLLGYPARHWPKTEIADDDENWNKGYEHTGYFLLYIQQHIPLVPPYNHETFLSALNRELKFSYSDGLFEKLTQYKVKDLFSFYKKHLKENE